MAACGSSETASSGQAATSSAASADSEIAEETAGPYPGDGSNGPNALTESGVVRSDIRGSFGGSSGTADGMKTTVDLTLLDVSAGGKPLAGAAVYLWHCDMAGRYSMYDEEVASEDFCAACRRATPTESSRSRASFPRRTAGRWPHIHFEVYESVDAATSASSKLRTSQIALPKEACDLVYATKGYEQSVQNLAQTSLDGDNVFSDGYAGQLASWSGSPDQGIALKLNVGV